MQVVQKTNTYKPEDHLNPCLVGRLKLLGSGHPIGTLKARVTPNTFIRRRETFTRTLEEGIPKPDWITFCVRERGNDNLFTHDIRVTSLSTLTVNAGAEEIRHITAPGSLEYSFGLSRKFFKRDPRLGLLGLQIPTEHKLLKIRDSLRQSIVAKLDVLVAAELEDQEFNMELNDLATTLLSTTAFNEEYEADSNRSRIVARATEAIRHTDPRDLSPNLIAAQAYTSVRTLEYAFREVLEMTPKQYIDFYRINLLREKLIAAPQIPILQLGDEVGLPHLGNLSRNYRNIYGETPSVTKKRILRL